MKVDAKNVGIYLILFVSICALIYASKSALKVVVWWKIYLKRIKRGAFEANYVRVHGCFSKSLFTHGYQTETQVAPTPGLLHKASRLNSNLGHRPKEIDLTEVN